MPSADIPDYEDVYAALSVAALDREIFPDGKFNAAIACCDRWPLAAVALRWIDKQGRGHDWTFGELARRSRQFANLLVARGVRPGDRVAGLLTRRPELVVTLLGAFRAGAVYQPVFTAFGPRAIEARLISGEPELVVADADQTRKLDGLDFLAGKVLSFKSDEGGKSDFWDLLDRYPDSFAAVPRAVADPFLILFTSGTTGTPKGVLAPLSLLRAVWVYMRYAVDLRADDRFWNLADPGWAYGLYYAVIGPLLLGQATMMNESGFDPAAACKLIERFGVTNLAGSPTAYRALMAADPAIVAPLKGKLRVVSSAGEPLNPEVIRWFDRALDTPILDHFGQTEVGMALCNHHGLHHRRQPGSMGFSMPGFRTVVIDDAGKELEAGQPGQLAVDRAASPLFWFDGYWRRSQQPFVGQYYTTGDTAELNDDGSISFVSRADDVITSSGYRIGPFEVESALLEHPAVLEAAVIGKPDPQRTEIVKAIVVLRPGIRPSAALGEELQAFVKTRLSAHAYPREVAFTEELPKTPSGKIQRFILRAAETSPS